MIDQYQERYFYVTFARV